MWLRGRLRQGKPSATAQRVAAHRLTFERVATSYGDPEADVRLARDVAAGVAPSTGRMHEYLRARTAFFDRVVVNALDDGMSQVVIGAAGYDGRAYRYAKPGVSWFELDHPSTQADKLARLARLGVQSGHVRFVGADFASDPVAERLLGAGLDPQSPSLFLLEGVAVYLELAVLARLLHQLGQMAARGSPLAMSVSLALHDPVARARFYAAVASMGEPARSTLEPDEAAELMRQAGWVPPAGDSFTTNGGTSPDAAALLGESSTGEEESRQERQRRAGFLIATATDGEISRDEP